MKLVKWEKAYSVASGDVDEDHKHLMAIINDLYGAMAGGERHEVIADILRELREYAEDHFRREERMMAECGYAGAAEHTRIHDKLLDSLSQVSDGYESGSLPLSLSMVVSLKTWLVEHMTESDRCLAPVFATASTGRSPAAA